AVLDNDSYFSEGKGIGDPTEYCLLTMSDKAGLNHNEIRNGRTRLEEVPFDSDRKLMSVKYDIDGVKTVFTKGAVDVILQRTVNLATKSGVRPFTEADGEAIVKQNQYFSENGLRVLAFAYKEVGDDDVLSLETENGYTFVGLVSIIDPPRDESTQAVKDAIRAGIKPVMITGDHKVTATAIAKQIGIFQDGDMAMTGQEVDRLTDDELDEILERVTVYARVSPENKIRIVDAWQRKGVIVAMTGDGVNDAPALKKADIGVAMGITGTEVSKDAAAMILSDDNFATIIKAVENGRNVYKNIRNAIQFLLSGNLAGILTVLYCSLMALPAPFAPVHLLFINLLTDSLPALAIGMEQSDSSLLDEKPRDPNTGILTKDFSIRLLGFGTLIAIATIAAFYYGYQTDAMTATTMAFATLTLARLFHGFNCRGEKPLSKLGLMSNKWSVLAFAAGVVFLLMVLYVPFLKRLFLVAPLTIGQLGFIAAAAVIPTIIIQMIKMINNNLK
ncbi:MAG: cation-translocating P-type ATPase, partial [Firmicutes bacterium]|nr:cation-translocating P-type ATPase [Bacillota bacterium]